MDKLTFNCEQFLHFLIHILFILLKANDALKGQQGKQWCLIFFTEDLSTVEKGELFQYT